MSQQNPSEYPTAIPVAKRRVDKPEPAKKRRLNSVQLPWLHIAVGGGVAWVVVVLVIAFFSFFQDGSRRVVEEPLPMPAIKPIAPQVAAPRAAEPEVAEAKKVIAPPAAPAAKAAARDEDFVDCGQIGTDVRFMRDPAAAFQRAAAEKKMVFMVHLSGNLEDKDFT